MQVLINGRVKMTKNNGFYLMEALYAGARVIFCYKCESEKKCIVYCK